MKRLKNIKNLEDRIFHCYIPYSDRELFIIALSKISIENYLGYEIVDEIIDYFDNAINFSSRYVGFFLRFFNNNWDFYEVETKNWNNIERISKKLEDSTFNEDGLSSILPEGKSIYIGEIRLTKNDIDLYKNMRNFNI